jgi:hypothetical protein
LVEQGALQDRRSHEGAHHKPWRRWRRWRDSDQGSHSGRRRGWWRGHNQQPHNEPSSDSKPRSPRPPRHCPRRCAEACVELTSSPSWLRAGDDTGGMDPILIVIIVALCIGAILLCICLYCYLCRNKYTDDRDFDLEGVGNMEMASGLGSKAPHVVEGEDTKMHKHWSCFDAIQEWLDPSLEDASAQKGADEIVFVDADGDGVDDRAMGQASTLHKSSSGPGVSATDDFSKVGDSTDKVEKLQRTNSVRDQAKKWDQQKDLGPSADV